MGAGVTGFRLSDTRRIAGRRNRPHSCAAGSRTNLAIEATDGFAAAGPHRGGPKLGDSTRVSDWPQCREMAGLSPRVAPKERYGSAPGGHALYRHSRAHAAARGVGGNCRKGAALSDPD